MWLQGFLLASAESAASADTAAPASFTAAALQHFSDDTHVARHAANDRINTCPYTV
jgi:hypothetical protein